MRVSDSLAANWNHLWVASILLFKFMELTKVLCLQGRFPTITLLVYSATFTLIVLSAAFVLDLAAMFQSVLHSKPGPVSPKTCKGGICWHNFPIVSDGIFE
ncbi:hypothetical protein V6N13_018392 [Hibiscus sabdariffa]